MDKRYQLQFSVETEGQLLREAIASWGISKRALTAIKFDGGAILVNGEEKNVRYTLQRGDVVTLVFPVEEVSEGLVAEQKPLKIIYEEEAG